MVSEIMMTIYYIIMAVAIVHVVMDNRQPAKTMAWVMVISFVPVAGVIFYFFFGINTRKERMLSRRSISELSKRSILAFIGQKEVTLPPSYRSLITLNKNSESMPLKDNHVDFFLSGYDYFPALLHEIAHATKHIHIDIFIFEDDALGRMISDALIDRAREGVEVRVIYDDVGCWSVRKRFFERMRGEGIQAVPFLPVHFPTFANKLNYRNHRKLIVVDGRVAFIGGYNIALRYVKGINGGKWRDTMMRIEGGVVSALQGAFLIDWFFTDQTMVTDQRYYPPYDSAIRGPGIGQVVLSSPTLPQPAVMQGYVAILAGAKQYVYMQSPYFLPTEPLAFAMKMAAKSGVDVRLMVPYHSDSKLIEWASHSYLREAHAAGIKVYLYKPGFLHSKLMVSDNAFCTCGSTNLDFRSCDNDFEANIFFYDEALAIRARALFMADIPSCVTLTETGWMKSRSFLLRLCESLTRLLSPLF